MEPLDPPPLPTIVIAFLFHLVYLVLPVSFCFLPVYLYLKEQWAAASTLVAIYLAWLVISHPCEVNGKGMPWVQFENLWLWRRLFQWFPIRLVKPTKALSPDHHQYIFAFHPHGGIAFGRAMFGFCTRHFWESAFPGIPFRVLTATSALKIPFIREAWLWSYCIDASKPCAVRALQNGMSLVLCPGGVKEQIRTERGKHCVFLKSRKGFVKLALQHGCWLVPVYVFGETDLYHHWSIGLASRQWIADRFGVAVVILSGSFGLLPYRVPITGVSGPPIHVHKVENPTQEQIDNLHATYMRALHHLFDSEKDKYGYKDAVLEIL